MWECGIGEVGNFVTHTVTEFLFLHFLLAHHSYLQVLFKKIFFYFHLLPLVFAHCQIASYSTGLASCIHLIGIHLCAHTFCFHLLNITSIPILDNYSCRWISSVKYSDLNLPLQLLVWIYFGSLLAWWSKANEEVVDLVQRNSKLLV